MVAPAAAARDHPGMSELDDFWEQPDVVARFAARDPDQRLLALVPGYEDPAATRVLDLGCAAGRNTIPLAERGFDVHALDASRAMVRETRRRLAAVLGEDAADERVRRGRMDDLGAYADHSFDLVIALGLLHGARSWEEWQRAFREIVRVLRPGGRLLLAEFSPETDHTGENITPVAGEPHVYTGLHGGRGVLLHVAELDAEAARHGLRPEVPTTTGETRLDTGRRVSVNALYRKVGG